MSSILLCHMAGGASALFLPSEQLCRQQALICSKHSACKLVPQPCMVRQAPGSQTCCNPPPAVKDFIRLPPVMPGCGAPVTAFKLYSSWSMKELWMQDRVRQPSCQFQTQYDLGSIIKGCLGIGVQQIPQCEDHNNFDTQGAWKAEHRPVLEAPKLHDNSEF